MVYNRHMDRERLVKAYILGMLALLMLGVGFFSQAYAQVVGVTLPSVPTGVTATAGSSPGQVSLSWSASTESSGTIEGYYVYRNGGLITNTAGTSIVDGGLLPGYYSYTVAAYDANNNTSAQSPLATVTLIANTTPPSVPTGLTISGATTTNSYYTQVPLTISWNASTDNVGVVGYYVARNGVSITPTGSTLSGTSITDTVTPGTYTYSVEAYDAAQNVSAPTSATITISIDSIPPSTPTGVAVQQVSGDAVNVSWGSSTDATSVAGYQIFRNGIQVASATGSPYADSGLSIGSTYQYTVAAYDIAGNISLPSAPPTSVTIQQVNGPSTPAIINTTLVGTSTADFSWAIVADPLALTGYTVYRDGTEIAMVTSTSYLDPGLSPGLHGYTVTASDVSGATSAMSATSTIIIPEASAVSTMTTSTTAGAAASLPPAPSSSAVQLPSPASGTATASLSTTPLTAFLYYGLRNAQVTALQSILADGGYLAPIYTTGFFGNITLSAVEKFQCDQNVVCTGGAGWGTVGPRTRAALNALQETAFPSASVAPAQSDAELAAELQTLLAELAALQKQAALQ
jgi:hypothetical protein